MVVPAALIVAIFPDMEMTLVSGTEKVKLDVLLDVGVAIRVNVPLGEKSTTIGSITSKVVGAFATFTVIKFEILI